jgi:hypothetical protein
LLPVGLLDFQIVGGLARPIFFREPDLAWLRLVVDETTRFVGRPWRELEQRLGEPMPILVPHADPERHQGLAAARQRSVIETQA